MFDGAADPTVIYNRAEKEWWMFYTQRRAGIPVVGVSGSFGCAVGIASSADQGKTWIYRGTAQGLDFEWGHNTFWAPEVIFDPRSRRYHMIATYIRGIPKTWQEGGAGKCGMVHYVSDNLWQWEFQNFVFENSSLDIIDACLFPLEKGGFRMWYRDTAQNSSIWYADTEDFRTFTQPKKAVDGPAEGPNVFRLGDWYWMITDPLGVRSGLAVYRSRDLLGWEKQPQALLQQQGQRPLDDTPGRHADVVCAGDEGYIFYFTQPFRNYHQKQDFTRLQDEQSVCVVQAARLQVRKDILLCDRDEDFQIRLLCLQEEQDGNE